jgi:hypothetical protein
MLSDEEFASGLERMNADLHTYSSTGPVEEPLELVVFGDGRERMVTSARPR